MIQVERMAKQLKVAEDASYTCETAAHFWLLHVLARWERFLKDVREHKNSTTCVKVTCLSKPHYFFLRQGASLGSGLFSGPAFRSSISPHPPFPQDAADLTDLRVALQSYSQSLVGVRFEGSVLLQVFFPFKEYFADAGELFLGESYETDMEKARGCFRHLKIIFQELEECRAFELLKVLPSFSPVSPTLHEHSP
jgi:hypothetical protein